MVEFSDTKSVPTPGEKVDQTSSSIKNKSFQDKEHLTQCRLCMFKWIGVHIHGTPIGSVETCRLLEHIQRGERKLCGLTRSNVDWFFFLETCYFQLFGILHRE